MNSCCEILKFISKNDPSSHFSCRDRKSKFYWSISMTVQLVETLQSARDESFAKTELIHDQKEINKLTISVAPQDSSTRHNKSQRQENQVNILVHRISLYLKSSSVGDKSLSQIESNLCRLMQLLSHCKTMELSGDVRDLIFDILTKPKINQISLIYCFKILQNQINNITAGEISRIFTISSRLFRLHSVKLKCCLFEFWSKYEVLFPNSNLSFELFTLARSYLGSFDCRLKISALKFMKSKFLNFKAPDIAILQPLVNSVLFMTNDYEVNVRLEALCTLANLCLSNERFSLSLAHPEYPHYFLISDYLFIVCCFMINDYSVKIKVKALEIMLQISDISETLALDSIDKRLFSDLMVNMSSTFMQDINKLSSFGSLFTTKSSFRKGFAKLDPSILLYKVGAKTALINALEDEHESVRSLAIQNISRLANIYYSFNKLGMSLILDAFDDEVHSVRLDALKSFEIAGGTNIIMKYGDLSNMMVLMMESSYQIRQKARKCLAVVKYSTPDCVNLIFKGLKDVVNEYPYDLADTFMCIKKIGENNKMHVHYLLEDLLELRTFFDAVEPTVTDLNYAFSFVLIANSVGFSNELFKSNLPFFETHARYFQSAYGEYLPDNFPETINGLSNNTSPSKSSKFHTNSPSKFICKEKDSVEIEIKKLNSMLLNIAKSDNMPNEKHLIEEGIDFCNSLSALTTGKDLYYLKFISTILQYSISLFIANHEQQSAQHLCKLLELYVIDSSECLNKMLRFMLLSSFLLTFHFRFLKSNECLEKSYRDFLHTCRAMFESSSKYGSKFINLCDQMLNNKYTTEEFVPKALKLIFEFIAKIDRNQIRQLIISNLNLKSAMSNKNSQIICRRYLGVSITVSMVAINLDPETSITIQVGIVKGNQSIELIILNRGDESTSDGEIVTLKKDFSLSFDSTADTKLELMAHACLNSSIEKILRKSGLNIIDEALPSQKMDKVFRIQISDDAFLKNIILEDDIIDR
ncbi:MAG: Integrator complex subunit 4 [Marteilia pararefringens]